MKRSMLLLQWPRCPLDGFKRNSSPTLTRKPASALCSGSNAGSNRDGKFWILMDDPARSIGLSVDLKDMPGRRWNL